VGGHDGVTTTTDVEQVRLSPLTLAALSPASASVFGPTFTLTLTGTNFMPNATVYWNGTPLTTTYVSNTQLTAWVPSDQLDTVGNRAVYVRNPDSEHSGMLTFVITKANQVISFDPLPNRYIGDPPFTVAATSSSGLFVTFTSTGMCDVSGDTVTLTATGECTITAHQAGDANYNAALDVPQSFLILTRVMLPLVMREYPQVAEK
jgi:hypothetical protein